MKRQNEMNETNAVKRSGKKDTRNAKRKPNKDREQTTVNSFFNAQYTSDVPPDLSRLRKKQQHTPVKHKNNTNTAQEQTINRKHTHTHTEEAIMLLCCVIERQENVQPACEKTLSDLGLGYVDLYLVHFPISLK